MVAKLSRKAEESSTRWLAEMVAMNDVEFIEQLQQFGNTYLAEYEILNIIRKLTDDIPVRNITAATDAVRGIEIKNGYGYPDTFMLNTVLGNMGFCKLSELRPFIDDGFTTTFRQGMCHEKAFEIFEQEEENARLVTGLVSVLLDQHTFLHSWVEVYDDCVYDYTLNAAIGIPLYKKLMHTQEPLIVVDKRALPNGKIRYKDWVAMVQGLYDPLAC